MNRFCHGYRPCYYLAMSSFFAKFKNPIDRLEDPPEYIPKNGIERVIKTFGEKSPGEPTPEFISLVQITCTSFVAGVCVGGFKKSKKAADNFLISHQHETFISAYEAKRKLHDVVLLNFVRGGMTWGLKAAAFTMIYCFCIYGIPAYREKDGILEYSAGGALAGGISRAYLGLKAALSGALIGGVFATAVGCIIFLSSKLVNVSMSDVKQMQYGWYKARREAVVDTSEFIRRKQAGSELADFLKDRDVLMKRVDPLGYSETDKVFIVVPNREENEDNGLTSASVENVSRKEEIENLGKENRSSAIKTAAEVSPS